MLFDKHINVSRLTVDSGNADKETYIANLALQGVPCNIQPASPEFTAIADGIFTKTYQAFVTKSGILDGDRVTVSGTSNNYTVKGIEDWNMPPLPHFRLVLTEAE